MRRGFTFCAMLAVAGACFATDAASAATDFEASDSLRIFRILERPAISADGSMVAYVGGDWQHGRAIRAHKKLGRLLVHRRSGAPDVLLSSGASDPVWSRSGQDIAYFEGLGEGRELVVADPDDPAGTLRRFTVAGNWSRYSARHFAPVWSRDDRFLLVAEAKLGKAVELADPAPYTLSAGEAITRFDAHFQDHALWQLVRIDLASGERATLTPYVALREMYPSPSGDRLLLALAPSDQPGRFVGDVYQQTLGYHWLDVPAGGALRDVALASPRSIVGWLDERRVLARGPGGLAVVDAETASISSVLDHPFVGSAAGFAHGGTDFVAWKTPASEDDEAFVIMPPSGQQVMAGSLETGIVREILGSGEGQEVLDAMWLAPDRLLLLHTRRLDTLDEHLLLWDGTATTILLETGRAIGPVAAAAGAEFLVFPAEQADMPPEIFGFLIAERRLERWSRHNAGFAGTGFARPVLIEDESAADAPLRALLYLPPEPSLDAGKTAFVVSAYGRQTHQRHRFNAEAQMHIAQGYGYLLPDVYPRRGALREAYLETVPAVVERVRSRFPNLGSVGFLGGSLGGYAGLVLLTHGERFEAAVLRAPPAEFTLSWATGKDRDAELLEYLMQGQRPDQNPQAYRADSPLWQVDRIRTPVRLLHGSDDQQVPLDHSLWVFQSLRRLGRTPAELRIYPGADHSIVRGSKTYYLDYYQQIFSWWHRHLYPRP